MKSEAIELAKLYFEKIEEKNASANWKKTMVQKMEDMLNEYEATLIRECIEEDANKFDSLIKSKLRNPNKPVGKNLLVAGQFYYHPLLQVAPPPPTITINSDGSFTESYANEEFYLKIKDYFDLKQAIDYLATKFRMKEFEKSEGRMKYLYENKIVPVAAEWAYAGINPVDLLLFTIDAAQNILVQDTSKDYKLHEGIFGLSDYIDHGLEIYKEKVNYCKLSDLTHVY